MKAPELNKLKFFVFDFDGVMTDDSVFLDLAGNEFVRCSRSDGAGIKLVHESNGMNLTDIKMIIVSSETNRVAITRANKLGIECHSGIEFKHEFLADYAVQKLGISSEEFFSHLVYFGNDLNDLKSMEAASFSIAPRNAHEHVKKAADLVIDRYGGDGFVRQAIELLLGNEIILEIVKRKYA
jgi:YrbI family 3-deoxy-D-manno-octulosonate 8-phosphate phosphatase